MKIKRVFLTWFITIATVSLLLGTMFLSTVQASPPAQDPRPTADVGGGGGSGGSGGGGSGGNGSGPSGDERYGEIVGTVTDITTDKPGAGIYVRINDDLVRTDAAGAYSLTSLYPGTYVVSLELPQEFTPAQPPRTIALDAGRRVVVDLKYYSGPAPSSATPTLTPTPATITTTTITTSTTSITTTVPSAEEFAPPGSATPESQLSITPSLTLPVTSSAGEDSPGEPPDALPITGNTDLMQSHPPDRLPATAFSAISLLTGLGLSGLIFLTRYVRSSYRNKDKNSLSQHIPNDVVYPPDRAK